MHDNDNKNNVLGGGSGISSLSELLQRDGFRSPDLFVQRIDPIARSALILRMRPAAYRKAIFLDRRVLPLTAEGFVMPHDDLVGWTQAIADPPLPIHFIFHSGHVGSTLLSRLIDEAPGVLGLREPPPLKTLAEAHDRLGEPNPPLPDGHYERWFATQLRLWRRGYDNTRSIVVKATSDAARIGHLLLQAAPEAKAILLNVTAETYLALALSGASSVDIETKLAERTRRLTRLLGAFENPQSRGEKIALSWLAEQLTHDRLSHPWPGRMLRLDFDAFLADPSAHLDAVFHHLRIERPTSLGCDVSAHVLMRQYSKSPERVYSSADRSARLKLSRRENAAEIACGLTWLERLAGNHPRAAAALAA